MNSAILFACFFSVVMGNTETCKANDHSCVASASDEEEVNLMQVRAQVRRASNRHTYGPHKTQSALKYFVKWSHGKVANHMRNFIRTNPSKLALGQESAVIDKQCHKKTAAGIKSFVEMHRLRECRETAKTMRKAQFSLLDSYTDKSGVEHFVLRSNGALQYVAKHFSRVVAAYPELCPASKSASLRQKIKRVRHDRAGVHELDKPDLSEDKPEKGGAGKNLDPKSDQLVEDCKDLFHRTAKEKCDKDFELDVISAVEGVVAGLRVEMQIKVSKLLPNSSYATFFHDIACDFMTDDDSEDAKLLQKAPEKDDKDDKDEKDEKKTESDPDGADDEKEQGEKKFESESDPCHGLDIEDQLPEEKKGMVATLEMDENICKAAEKSTMDEKDVDFFLIASKRGFGELSRYKGFEHVNDNLPKVTNSVLMQFSQNVAASVDLREKFPKCYPDSYKEVVRDQGVCGSCWAFASASAIMNNLCGSAPGSDQSLATAADRYEVSVQQIMSCNSDKVGCDGGYASAAHDACQGGITQERQSGYQCGGGDPLNHFDASGGEACKSFPWGGTCDTKLAYAGWNWGGASGVDGEAPMKNLLSEGYALYASLDVYADFMTLTDQIYTQTSGAKKGGHALVAVGYGTSDSTPYWILQNSWGTSWGVNGYGKIKRGTDLCGIETGAYYMRAWVSEATKVPPCFDAAASGLVGGSGPIPCSGAKGGAFGNLCTDATWGSQVKANCPVTCDSCSGGKSGSVPLPPSNSPAAAEQPDPAPTPAPAPSTCDDSKTYKDPYFGDDCKNWASFACTGFSFTDELKANCPVACKTCKPASNCNDDPSYTDPTFGDSCLGWAAYACDGFDFTAALKKACPKSCKTCS